MRAASFALLVAFSVPGSSVLAQEAKPPASDPRAAAAAAFDAEDHERAAALYREITEKDPEDAVAWMRLGYCLHNLGRLDEALPAHRRAAETAGEGQERIRAVATYNVACVHARRGEGPEALEWLESAVARGFRNADMMQHDPDLASIRSEPRFLELVRSLASARKRIGIVVHEGVEILDFSGPAEVFSAARHPGGERRYEVILVAPKKEPVRCQNVLGRIVPEHGIEDCPKLDVILVPGGATQNLLEDAPFMEWFGRAAGEAEAVVSVCTGAFVLAKAGLLDGKEATTHHSALADLRREHPKVTVREGVRFVDGGKVITAGGVAAGIDAAFRFVERDMGEEAAKRTASYMEYAWPPAPRGD